MRNWYEIYQKGKHSPKHDSDIERSVKLVEEHFPGVRMKDLTKDLYQRFINDVAPNYATETVRKRHLYIKNCIKDAIEVSDKEITCHGLRHTHASILLFKGVNVKYISRRLGHKNIIITLQTYSHFLDEMEQKESRQVDATMEELFHAK